MSWLLFGVFAVLMCMAVPLAVALGLAGAAVIVAANMGIMSVPTTVYSGIEYSWRAARMLTARPASTMN